MRRVDGCHAAIDSAAICVKSAHSSAVCVASRAMRLRFGVLCWRTLVMHFMSVLATLAAGSASEVGPSENINCTYMLNKLTQRKPVLGERAADAARQHAHIDTNRTYNETTRDRTYSSRTQS